MTGLWMISSEHCGDGSDCKRRPIPVKSVPLVEGYTSIPAHETAKECLNARFVMRKWRLLRAAGDL